MGDIRLYNVLEVTALFVVGIVLGTFFLTMNLPMPYLMSSLLATSAYSIFHANRQARVIRFPKIARQCAIAVIGVMIGTGFTPEVMWVLPTLWPSIAAMVFFVILMQCIGFLFYRHVGRYDAPTAYFAAMPGGFIEAITLGEAAGANTSILIIQHFGRIIIIVLVVPMSFFLFSGAPVGSGAGQSFGSQDFGPLMGLMWVLMIVSGMLFGKHARLPASHLMGPLILSSMVHATGLISLASPSWLLNLAQLVIGVALGVMFSGMDGKLLFRTLGLGLVAVTIALGVGMAFAGILVGFVDLNWTTLLISFAPGGVAEMGLIALSLGINPVIVAVHHLFRILFTVGMAGMMSKWYLR